MSVLLSASVRWSSASVVYSFDGSDEPYFTHLQWQFVSPTIADSYVSILPSELFNVVSPFPITMAYVVPGGPAAAPAVEVTFGPNATDVGVSLGTLETPLYQMASTTSERILLAIRH
jgi:hypothetical protein